MRSRLAVMVFATALAASGAALAQPAEQPLAEDPDEAGYRAGFESDTVVREAEAHGDEAHHGPDPVNWIDLGYGDKDVAGGELEKGDVPMSPPLVLALINFGLFLWLLFGKVPIGSKRIGFGMAAYLRRRFQTKHDTIKAALEEGARLREEARQKLEEYNQRIQDVDTEVSTLIAQIRSDAEAERERILAEAQRQAEQTVRDAQDRIDSEIAGARRALEREVVAAATLVAERLLRERSTAADQTALVEDFLSHIGDGDRPSPSPTKPTSTDEGWS